MQVDIGAGSGDDLATLFSAAAVALAVVLNHGPPSKAKVQPTTNGGGGAVASAHAAPEENEAGASNDEATVAMAVAVWREAVLRSGEALLEVIEHLVSNTESCRVRLRVRVAPFKFAGCSFCLSYKQLGTIIIDHCYFMELILFVHVFLYLPV